MVAEDQRALGEQRCRVRSKAEELIPQRRSIMVLILAYKEQVVPLKEPEAPPTAGQPSSAAVPADRLPEGQCRPMAAVLPTWWFSSIR
jgi:hypothetical protein